MAKFEGTLPDFMRFIDPLLRNTIQRATRPLRTERNHVCEHCEKSNGHLQSAHRRETPKSGIYAKVLANYPCDGEQYVVADLGRFMTEIVQAHKPFGQTFLFLCKSCHDIYDDRGPKKT